MASLLKTPAVVLFRVRRESTTAPFRITRKHRIGLNHRGMVLWTTVNWNDDEKEYASTDPLRFDYIQLLDRDGHIRLSSHVWAGEVSSAGTSIRIAFAVLSPLVDVARTSGPLDKTRNCYNRFDLKIAERELFAGDGSIQLASLDVDCVSYGPYHAKYGRVSLAELARQLPANLKFTRSTDWSASIDEYTFGFLYRLLGGRTAGLRIDPATAGAASLRIGLTALPAAAAKTRLVIDSAAVIKGNAPRTLVLDPLFAADDPLNPTFTPKSLSTVVRVVNDINNEQPGIGPTSPGLTFDASLPWYVVVEQVPMTAFTSIWNELVARPYLRSLRAIEDASDLSFVPVLKPVDDGASTDCDVLFDVTSATPETLRAPGGDDIVDPDTPTRGDERGGKFGAPVAISFRPHGGTVGSFTADATFPGLITHDRKAVSRRVTVTVIRKQLEWFEEKIEQQQAAQFQVKITSAHNADKFSGGGKLRVGALDLVVPGKEEASDPDQPVGAIDLTFDVTFDAADPLAAGDASEKGRLRGQIVRARLPRRGEAVPRITATIEKFDLSDVLPGSQDQVPDAAAASDAVVEELASMPSDPRSARERRIRSNLTRSAPIIIDQAGSSKAGSGVPGAYFLTGREITERDRNRKIVLTLRRTPPGTPSRANRTVVIDPEPMTVALVDVPAFDQSLDESSETDGEIANWQTSETEGARWEIARISKGFDLYLPPQATGEAAEKGYPWTAISPSDKDAATIDYRLGTQARVKLRSSFFKQRYSEAPWNLRRILGYPGQRAPGAGLATARFELLYGLGARFTGGSLRLAELGSRIGAVRDPLPARPLNIKRPLTRPLDTQSDLEAEVYDRFRDGSAALTKAYNTRVGVFEVYREGAEGVFATEDGVAFALRLNGSNAAELHPEPWNPAGSEPLKLRGGATWGFESRNIYEEVVPPGKPPTESTRGQIVGPTFSALGGSGFVRAYFADGKSRIVSSTQFGRTSTYSLERIGRIGVFWNIAKHVIVYERTVLPPDQFATQQKDQHIGRPVLRKVREYVDILQAERTYPENAAPVRSRGFVEACVFRTSRIPVDGSWGRDVPGGWIIPLWKADADPDLYPKPDVRLRIAAAQTDAGAAVPGLFKDPSQLVFYTSTKAATDDPNLWPAHEGVDYVDMPKPAPVGQPTLDASDPDGMAPSDLMRDPLLDRCTFDIDTSGLAASLTEGRTNGDRIAAVIETVSMARSAPAPASGDEAAKVLDVARELERIASSVKSLESVLNEGLARARRLIGECLVTDPRELKSRILLETARLRESKAAVRSAAALARKSIREAVDRARQELTQLASWEEKVDSVRARIEARAVAEIDGRFADLFEVIARLRDDAVQLVAEGKEVALRRLDDAYRPIGLTLESGAGTIAIITERIRAAVISVDGAIENLDATLRARQAEIGTAIDALGGDKLKSQLVALVDTYADLATRHIGDLQRAVDRLPRRVSLGPSHAIERDMLRTELEAARKKIADFRATFVRNIAAAQDDGAKAKQAAKASLEAVYNLATSGLARLRQAVKDLKSNVDEAETEIDRLLKGVGSGWDTARKQIEDAVQISPAIVIAALDGIKRPELPSITSAVRAVADKVAAFADQLDANLNNVKQDVTTRIGQAEALANVGVDQLETQLLLATDVVAERLEAAANGTADALAEAATELENYGSEIGKQLQKVDYAGVAEATRLIEEGYARLSRAPTFQNPSETLSLIRAAGSSPILPNLKFNRERIAYFFDDAREAVRTTPVVALMNRADDDLKALGIRLPTSELLDRLIPSGLESFDFGKLFPDLGGLKLDGLFKNLRLPSSINDNVKITHGFDKASLTAWAKAEAKSELPPRSDVFAFGPLSLAVVKAGFHGLADVALLADGTSKRKTTADIVGDWELGFAGRTLITLEKTRIHYEDGRGLDVDIDPRRVRLDSAVRFLSDLIKSYSEPSTGFFLEMMEEDGLPAGLAARLDLPMPPLSFGAFSVWGLRFTSAFGLHVPMGSGKRDFAISTAVGLGRKTEPFILRVWILVGGGWLETQAKYFPTTGRTESRVSMGLTAGLGLDFAFGPCHGYVFVMLGVSAEFSSGSNLAISVMFLVRGGIVILGRFNIGLNLLLELTYRDDGSAVGYGTLEVTFKICWCCKIKVRQSVTYQLRKSSKLRLAAAPAPRPHYLDHFA